MASASDPPELVQLVKREEERRQMVAPEKMNNMQALGAAVRNVTASFETEHKNSLEHMTAIAESIGEMCKTLGYSIDKLKGRVDGLEDKLNDFIIQQKTGLGKLKSIAREDIKIFGVHKEVRKSKPTPKEKESEMEQLKFMMTTNKTVPQKDQVDVDLENPARRLNMEDGNVVKIMQRMYDWMHQHPDSEGNLEAPGDVQNSYTPRALQLLKRIKDSDNPSAPGNGNMQPHEIINATKAYLQRYGRTLDEGIKYLENNKATHFGWIDPADDMKDVEFGIVVVKDAFEHLMLITTEKTKMDYGAVAKTVHAVIRLFPPKVAEQLRHDLRPSTEEDALAVLTPQQFIDKLRTSVLAIYQAHQDYFYENKVDHKENKDAKEAKWETHRGRRGKAHSDDPAETRGDKKEKGDEGDEPERGRRHARFAAGGGGGDRRSRSRSGSATRHVITCSRCFTEGHKYHTCISCKLCHKSFYNEGANTGERINKLRDHSKVCPNKGKKVGDIACASIEANKDCSWSSCPYLHDTK